MTIPENFPGAALFIVREVARRHKLTPEDIFKPWPREPWIDAARVEAIGRLANEEIGGRRMFSQSKLAAWFDVRRERISTYAMRWPGYVPRRRKPGDMSETRPTID